MLKEALQYILDGMRPETQDLCGRAYVITPSGAQEVIAMKLVNDISLGAKVIYNDNGVATTVTTKSGVSLQTNEAIRPIVKLRPYRTFQEVEQPESTFLIRINDRGISFIEADGGMWRLTARNTIKAFLEEKLAAEIESGKLVVAL